MDRRFSGFVLAAALYLCGLPEAQAGGTGPPHPEVLVVYNTNFSDSLTVANHYLAQRNIPVANLCAITPPDASQLSYSDYATFVKAPVQACLNTLGQKNILYIVFSYLTPYLITGVAPTGFAAVDSYVADIWDKYAAQPFLIQPNAAHGYYADSQSEGDYYQPFVSFATYRANPRSTLIYAVWRLDGPSVTIASALVDQAVAAEAGGGLHGQACIDRRFGTLTNNYDVGLGASEWDLHMAGSFLQQAGYTVVEDSNDAEFGTAPAPLTCGNTAFYSGWYSLNHYNDAFTWQTGAIGWHLDSQSAASPRSGNSWSANALLKGITITHGAVSEPLLPGLARPGGTMRNLLEGASVGDAFLRNTRWLKWAVINIGDPLYHPFGTGRTPFSPLQAVNSISFSPQEVVGGKSSTGTIILSTPAPAGGLMFNLSAGGGLNAIPQPTVTVPANATRATFTVTTPVVSNQAAAFVTATSSGPTLTATLTADPLLAALIPSAGGVEGGQSVLFTVVLNGQAPLGGAVIALTSDNSAAPVAPSMTVPAGTMVASFIVTTHPVGASTVANISATYAGFTRSFGLTIVP